MSIRKPAGFFISPSPPSFLFPQCPSPRKVVSNLMDSKHTSYLSLHQSNHRELNMWDQERHSMSKERRGTPDLSIRWQMIDASSRRKGLICYFLNIFKKSDIYTVLTVAKDRANSLKSHFILSVNFRG